MQILIELKLPNPISIGVCQAGNIFLSDGKSNVSVSGYTYYGNYLKSLSTFVHSANLLKGGALEEYESFSFDFVDNGLLYEIERQDLSLNQGTVQVFTWDGTTKTPHWFGYVIGSELGENVLTINCENLSKALKATSEPMIYGDTKNLKLSRDTTIPIQTLQFNSIGSYWSSHPTIYEVGSPLFTFSGSVISNGLVMTKSSATFITTKSVNDPFSNIPTEIYQDNGVDYYYPSKPFKVTFESGDNSGKSYRVKCYTETAGGGYWYKKIYLKDDFASVKIKAFDRISIANNVTYYKINAGVDSISAVYVKIADVFCNISCTNYEITIINGVKYLAVYPTDLVYREIPIDSIEGAYTYEPGNGTEVSASITTVSGCLANLLDNDFSNSFCYNFNTPTNITSVIGRYKIKADLTKAYSSDIYFGLNINFSMASHGVGDKNFQTSYQVTLLDGSVLNTDVGGTAIETIASGPLVKCKVQTAPYGDITGPQTINDSSYPPGNLTFDSAQFAKYKIGVDSAAYKDVNYITLQTRKYVGDGTGDPSGEQDFYKIGLYVQESIDSLDEVYIDTLGKCNYVSPSLKMGPWPIGSNDGIAKDILTTLGQITTSGFKVDYSDYVMTSGGSYVLSGINYNHLYVDSGDESKDALDTLAREGLLVVASQEDQQIYSRKLVMHQNDSLLNASISATDVIGIEPLSDVSIDDINNMPTINFKDSAGNTESIEVISCELSAFPTWSSVLADERSYSSCFKFSDNFLSTLKSKSPSEDVKWRTYGFLSRLYGYFYVSYVKNRITNSGTIDISTFYLSDLMDIPDGVSTTPLWDNFFSLIQMNSSRRKQIKFYLPLSYTLTTKIRVGDRIKIFHPNVMQNASIYGFVTTVETGITSENNKVAVTMLCDSYKDGNGNPDFF